MTIKAKNYKVSIFNEHYALVSDEPEAHILQSAQLVDTLMQEIAQKSKITDEKRVAVLAALQLASKVLQAESALSQEQHKQEELARHIDHALNSAHDILHRD
jgi:cell division protein ZapA (FtsZ GTPase activity inhibitor)